MRRVLDFADLSMKHVQEVGGKNASLGEMLAKLAPLGIKIPKGFATTVSAYQDFLQHNNLHDKINQCLLELDVNDVAALKKTSQKIRRWIMHAELTDAFKKEIIRTYKAQGLNPKQSVAVRSSATAEDLPRASFAGQQETYLNIKGGDNVLEAIKKVFASLFTERSIAYRVHHNFPHNKVGISAGVQQMIRSDLAASGVIFTLDTESGFDQVVFITASYGLGETIVQGRINPDEFYVHKPTLDEGKHAIISRTVGDKSSKMVYTKSHSSGSSVKTIKVPNKDKHRFCLTDEEVLELARQALIIEKHYGRPMDIEWAKDGVDGELYIIQARPETVKARDKHQVIEQYQLKTNEKAIVKGRSIGQKIGQGVARVIKTPKEMDRLKEGEILVTDFTDPDWEPIMKRSAAIVTNRGGRTCHAAIIAREMGIPAVVGCHDATRVIKEGDIITVSCAEGETGYVYKGKLPYGVDTMAINELPDIPVQLCINLANPESAFACQFLPNHGVGLARLEFIIGNMIGVHPNALLQFDRLPKALRSAIKIKSAAYHSPVEYYIEKLAEGISTIAAAFYPKPIIVRFSDFKSNEYANLLGGDLYEPHEENPMLGYRGAARYVSGNFRDSFILECEAIKRVRNDKGLINTHVMLPFVRTLHGAKDSIELLKSCGLERGQDGLLFYMMCEIPSNAILAEEFLEFFDGFSIGSNDLTQLTLGLDRDSELVADLFDERDPSVLALLGKVIATCRKKNKYVGICGQGPSDHLDFAKWLMEAGVNSMSLSSDAVVKTWMALGDMTQGKKSKKK